eukprot:2235036-Prymnesium_polylepis.1
MHHLYEMLRPVGIITLARRLQYQIQRLRHVPYLEVFLESQGRGQGGTRVGRTGGEARYGGNRDGRV